MPLPRLFQSGPANLAQALRDNILDLFIRMSIIVVQSDSLARVLRDLATDSGIVSTAEHPAG